MAELADNEPNDGLCDACSVLRFKDKQFDGFEGDNGVLTFPKEEEGFDLEYNRQDSLPFLPGLKTSAERGCPFCAALRAATLTLGLESHMEIVFRLTYLWGEPNLGHYGLSVLFVYIRSLEEGREDTTFGILPAGVTVESNAKLQRSLMFLVDAEDGVCREWLQLQVAPRRNALCEGNQAMLERELSFCTQQCKHPQPSGIPPTRLLDLQATNTTDGIRLLETSCASFPTAVRYAALSYCWGPTELAKFQLKTTHDTYSAHREGIPLNSMTKTLQDAVETTRALSIRYLWVDALCIIQGDIRDWMRESQRIGSVYINAHVTICTLGTSSCVESFIDRLEPTKVHFVSSIRPDIRGTYNLRFQPYHDTRSEIRGLNFGRRILMDAQSGAWGTRAWTCQEEQLSIRKIAFGPSQVHFSCPSHNVSESVLDRQPHFKDLATHMEEYRDNQDRSKLYQHWYELVENYAERNLTVYEDKLPALSGMASLMATMTSDDYVVGLWASDLVRGLLWAGLPLSISLDSLLNSSSAAKYIGPSWSWVNHKGTTVHFTSTITQDDPHASYFRSECNYINAWCSPEDRQLNPFGRIVDAAIEIEGKLAKVNKEVTPEGERQAPSVLRFNFGTAAIAMCLMDGTVPDPPDPKLAGSLSLLLLASDISEDQIGDDKEGSPTMPNSDPEVTFHGQGIEVNATLSDSTVPDSIPSHIRNQNLPHENSQAQIEDNTRGRYAIGLLLHSKNGTDVYVRVGMFKCFVADRGLNGFDKCKFQRVKNNLRVSFTWSNLILQVDIPH